MFGTYTGVYGGAVLAVNMLYLEGQRACWCLLDRPGNNKAE